MGRKAENAMRDRDLAMGVMVRTNREVILEVERRGAHVVTDGYPSQSMGGGGGSKGTHSDPVGAKALPTLDCPCKHSLLKHNANGCQMYTVEGSPCKCRKTAESLLPRDEVGTVCADIFATLARMAQDARKIEKLTDYLKHVHETVRGRQSTISFCQACSREMSGAYGDRPRSGYCVRCYSRWRRAGCPDRLAFEAQMKADDGESAEIDAAVRRQELDEMNFHPAVQYDQAAEANA